MKYLISLSLFLAATQAFSEATPRGNQLLRFVCPYSDEVDHLLILEQKSVVRVDDELETVGGSVDGSALIDLGDKAEFVSGQAKFRMRIFDANLNLPDGSKEEFIEDLLGKPAGLDWDNKLMDYTGYGLRIDDTFIFVSTGPYDFFRRVDIYLKGELKDLVSTNNGAWGYSGDGFYNCMEPVLIDEMTQ